MKEEKIDMIKLTEELLGQVGKKMKDKQITIPIGEEDIRLFQELIYHNREPFEWRFDGVDIKFIKDEGKE